MQFQSYRIAYGEDDWHVLLQRWTEIGDAQRELSGANLELALFWPIDALHEAAVVASEKPDARDIRPEEVAGAAGGWLSSVDQFFVDDHLVDDVAITVAGATALDMLRRCITCGRTLPSAIAMESSPASIAHSGQPCERCGRGLVLPEQVNVVDVASSVVQLGCVGCSAALPPHRHGCRFEVRADLTARRAGLTAGAGT